MFQILGITSGEDLRVCMTAVDNPPVRFITKGGETPCSSVLLYHCRVYLDVLEAKLQNDSECCEEKY